MANEIKLIDAILNINPNATCSIKENNVDKITWLDGTSAISKDDILAKQTALQTAYDNKKYQRDRKKEYPSIADQLDDIYHNGIDGWKATIKTTKDKYPKE
jgi:hypothetical protein